MVDRVHEKLIEILRPYAPDEQLRHAAPDTVYLQSLPIDSAEMVGIIVEVEDAFDIEIADEDLSRLLTLGDVVRAVQTAGAGS